MPGIREDEIAARRITVAFVAVQHDSHLVPVNLFVACCQRGAAPTARVAFRNAALVALRTRIWRRVNILEVLRLLLPARPVAAPMSSSYWKRREQRASADDSSGGDLVLAEQKAETVRAELQSLATVMNSGLKFPTPWTLPAAAWCRSSKLRAEICKQSLLTSAVR